jgi:serine/threonine protein kinase
MDCDSSRANPETDPAVTMSDGAAAPDKESAEPELTRTHAAKPDAGMPPGSDLVDSIALEAVTAPVIPAHARGAADERPSISGNPDEARTITAGPDRDSPSGPGPATEGDAGPDAMVGRRIGAYRLIARIGGGGMGSVYRATRVEDFAQDVAIKLIKREMDSDVILRRFQTEIKVQAVLGKHPNITGLLDAGMTEDGQLYFVMEYVDGHRIDSYCDNRRLDIPARLRLFGQVCGGVHFAHQHAMIHRDLKPSNILVTADGVPKLIDFGIAKLILPEPGDEDTGAAVTLTRTGERVLTPEYASPEQVQGEPVTTASDVYALGVVLYQLLTSRWPYQLKNRTTPEIFQAICEQAPERPSTAVVRRAVKRAIPPTGLMPALIPTKTAMPAVTPSSESPPEPPPLGSWPSSPPAPEPEEIAAARGTLPKRLKRILAGDLDTIVRMALRKEPERRYASAEQFADDIHRYLEGLPVRAHRDSAAYRAAKFVQRNAVAVAVGLILILALVAGVTGTTTGLILARRERDRAEDSFRQARQAVNQFFTRVSEERLLNQPGLHPLRKALLRDAQRFYENFLNQRSGDPALRAELAAARVRVAKITGLIGSPLEAAAQFQQAIAQWDNLVAAQPDNPFYREELARTLNDFGAVLMPLEGRRNEALRTFRHAQNLIEPLVDANPQSVSQRHELSLILHNIAKIQQDQGQPEDAIQQLQRVLTIESHLAEEDLHSLDPPIALAKAHALLGQIMVGQPEGTGPSLASYQQAVELLESVTREHPELADQSYLLAMYLGELNSVQQMAGRLDSALASARRSVEIFERLNRQYPGIPRYQAGLGGTYNMMSDLHQHRREPVEALAFARKARGLLDRLVAEHPEDTFSKIDLSKSYNNIGRGLQQADENVEALRSFQLAFDLLESIPNLDPRNNYNLACNVALCIPLIGAKNGSQGILDAESLGKGDRFRRQKYGDRAMEALRRAIRGGFVNPEILQSDPDLDPLRDRPDFQALIKEVTKQSDHGE